MSTLTIASVLFSMLALVSLVVITRRALVVTVDLKASIAGRRAEQPAPAAEQPQRNAPTLVQGTLRKARPDA
ncbi:hypothetical protein [Micromonospora arida]|uniref:Uncharacterized protein n=1 Tax=Micromonospora arida TaxID=2203715 RepID=A0A3N9XNW0_9ACTN|nr:hypothetical protein [Micromonospora arida]RQX14650.1 hypothetical protein DLJ58_01075 [Micromonospora arida]